MLESRTALVLYGTETGTSQDLAEELGRCLQRLHFVVDISGFDDVSYDKFTDYNVVVFAISTTGQGDFPGNSRKLWTSLLKKRLSFATLAGVEYALLGLGDSSYPKFNWAARKLDKRLKQLGAEQVLEPCEADEQGDESTDGAFLAWLPKFRSAILERHPLADGKEAIPDSVLLPGKWTLERLGQHVNGHAEHGSQSVKGAARDHPGEFQVSLTENRRVTPADHWQDVRFLTLYTPDEVEYLPGDALSIQPMNDAEDVQQLVDMMRWNDVVDESLVFRLNPTYATTSSVVENGPLKPPGLQSFTLRRLLLERLDINAIPRRSFFATIANYTDNQMHKERLIEFTDPQFLDEYYDYATRPRRSILEILQEFDSVKLPWPEVTNILPPLRPRQFSIASGGICKKQHPGTTFELLVAIVKYRTVIKVIRQGVCTRYLANLSAGSGLQVTLRKEGRFSDGQDLSSKNYMLIGTGTGIAPLRALIHEKSAVAVPDPASTTMLFFGARNADADYFFSDEWDEFSKGDHGDHNSGSFGLKVATAFSRDQKQKFYVQDRIKEHHAAVSSLLKDPKTVVIVCGSSGQMPKAVRQSLIDVLVIDEISIGGGDASTNNDFAEQFLARMEKEGRYKQETWS